MQKSHKITANYTVRNHINNVHSKSYKKDSLLIEIKTFKAL